MPVLTKEEKLKIASDTRAAIQKDYGKDSIMSLSDTPAKIDVISTGSIGLNIALGVGGLPKGRVVEIYGPESSGKTTLAIHVIAEAQKQGGLCAIIDAEHSFDATYAEKLGVNIAELDINQPDYGEQGLGIAERLINSGAYSVIVIDSVAALVPKAELEGDMGDSRMGVQARLMGQALRKITPGVKKHGVLVIFINQLRDKIGVMFGSPETTPGGNALKFYAGIRLDIRRSTTQQNSVFNADNTEDKIGNKVTVKVIKNKVAPPFKKAEFDVLYNTGIDKVAEIIEFGGKKGILKKWGKQVTYNEVKYDIAEFTRLIYDNPEFYTELEQKCYAD